MRTRRDHLLLAAVVAVVGLASCGEAAPELGAHQAAIVNGIEDRGHPAVGALLAGSSQACTATLIGRRSVLTAAHCVAKLSPVRFYPRGLEGAAYEAANVSVHPDYAGGNRADVAIVHLAQEVDGVEPLPLAERGPRRGEEVTLLGFGRTSEQGGAFGTKRATTSRVATIVETYYTIAGGKGNVCDGDSGGPTLVAQGSGEAILGVHSTKGAACGVEGYDMRVDAFRDWILRAVTHSGTAPAERRVEDHAPPSVRILSPAPSARVSQALSVDVSAEDDTRVVQVALRIDGQVAAALDRPPFAFTLEDLREGQHEITVTARDAAGRTAEATVRVSVSADAFDGPFGHPCDAADECQSRMCLDAQAAAGGICSRACSSDAPCADGFACDGGVCQALALAQAATLPAAVASAPQAAGCQLGGAPATLDLGLLLGLLALLAARRR